MALSPSGPVCMEHGSVCMALACVVLQWLPGSFLPSWMVCRTCAGTKQGKKYDVFCTHDATSDARWAEHFTAGCLTCSSWPCLLFGSPNCLAAVVTMGSRCELGIRMGGYVLKSSGKRRGYGATLQRTVPPYCSTYQSLAPLCLHENDGGQSDLWAAL